MGAHVFFEFCEICPEPGKHVGQPPFFVEESDDEFEIPEEEYVWDKAQDKTLRRTLLH